MDAVFQILGVIGEYLAKPEVSIAAAFVVELVLRVFPSKKPLSIAYAAAGVVKAGAKACEALAKVLSALAALLDKVLPQKLK